MLRNPMRPAAILALIAVSASLAPCVADPVELSTFLALARPAPTAVLQHGPSDSQAADLFLPSGDGPYPLAILIHGGCWSVTTAGREQLRHIGAELARRGIAVWSIGYRRANESGGGYPGTFRISARQLTGCDPMPLVMVWISRARSWSGTPQAGISHSGQRCGTGCRQAVLSTVLTPSYPAQSSVWPGLAILKPSHASCRSSAGRELLNDWPLRWIRQIDMPRFRRRPCQQRAFRS